MEKEDFSAKSTAHRVAICCSSTYSGNHPTLRIAVPIIQYTQFNKITDTYQGYEIMPWIFGKIIFNLIREMNETWPVDQYDLFVTKINNNPFNQYDVQTAGPSIWRQHSDKVLILQRADSLRQNMMPHIAEDLDEGAIETLLGQPPPTTQERSIPQRQRHFVEEDFWGEVGAPTPDEHQSRSRRERDLRERALRERALRDLDNALDNI